MDLNDIRNSVGQYLCLSTEELDVVDLLLAAQVANELEGDPVWLLLVAPPSSAKTELLHGFRKYRQARFLSSLNPQSLVSGWIDAKGRNGSFLLRIPKQITLVIKDLTTLLSMRHESRAEVFSQLREIHDGHYQKEFGNGTTVEWSGKLGIISAVTPIIDRHFSHNQVLGERFIQYRLDNNNRIAVAEAALRNATDIDPYRELFQEMVRDFLSQGFDSRTVQDDPEVDRKIASLADLTARARTGVPRNPYSRAPEVIPQPEGPGRLVKQLKLLGTGLALVRARGAIDKGIYRVLLNVARHSLPLLRFRVLSTLWEISQEQKKWRDTGEVATRVKVPFSTAKFELEDLAMIGLLERKSTGQGKTAKQWWKPSESWFAQARETEFFCGIS